MYLDTRGFFVASPSSCSAVAIWITSPVGVIRIIRSENAANMFMKRSHLKLQAELQSLDINSSFLKFSSWGRKSITFYFITLTLHRSSIWTLCFDSTFNFTGWVKSNNWKSLCSRENNFSVCSRRKIDVESDEPCSLFYFFSNTFFSNERARGIEKLKVCCKTKKSTKFFLWRKFIQIINF